MVILSGEIMQQLLPLEKGHPFIFQKKIHFASVVLTQVVVIYFAEYLKKKLEYRIRNNFLLQQKNVKIILFAQIKNKIFNN